MIGQLVKYLEKGQFAEAAKLFSEDGRFIDYCPAQIEKPSWFLYGKGYVEMFLRNRFSMGAFRIFDPVVLNETMADYYAGYDEIFVPALLSIEVRDGKISKAIVRPK